MSPLPWDRGPADAEPPLGSTTEPPAEQVTPPGDAPARPAAPQFGGATFAAESDDSEAAEGPGYVSARPLLMVGAAGPVVEELAHALHELGYRNKVAIGKALPVLDDELMRVVQQFQDDKGVSPHRPQGEAPPLVPGRDRHSGVVDALTWEALGLAFKVVRRYVTLDHLGALVTSESVHTTPAPAAAA